MTELQKTKKLLKETEDYAVNLRHENETLQKVLDSTKEELRKARISEKEWCDISNKNQLERNEWKNMAMHLMEQLVKVKAELEVKKLPF